MNPAVTYPTPGEKEPAVRIPADVHTAIQEQEAMVAAHKAIRPANHDIPALTAWSQAHELLTCRLETLKGAAQSGWKPCHVPTTQPTPTPKEEPVPSPKPMPYAERIVGLTRKYQDICAEVPGCKDKFSADQTRQKAHTVKHQISVLCKTEGREMPELQDIPANPFATRPGPPRKAAPRETFARPREEQPQKTVPAGEEEVMFRLPAGTYERLETETGLRGITPENVFRAAAYSYLAECQLRPVAA